MSESTKRSPGRPPRSAEPTADIHLLLPQSLADRLDAQRGEVPRIAVMRDLIEGWIVRGAPAPKPKPGRPVPLHTQRIRAAQDRVLTAARRVATAFRENDLRRLVEYAADLDATVRAFDLVQAAPPQEAPNGPAE